MRLLRFVLVLLAVSAAADVRAEPWPTEEGEEIIQTIAMGKSLEPSGAVWHARLESLVVVDDSGVIVVGNDFWRVDGDLEGVAIADPESSLIYLAVEHPDSVLEFDLESGLPQRTWDLTPWLSGPDKSGLEALTFVDGLFYAGLQHDGRIYVFSLEDDGNVKHWETLAGARDSDLSGLHYDTATETLLAIYDEHDVLVEMSRSGEVLREYELPGSDQEGIALRSHCAAGSDLATLFIAGDGGNLWRFEGYPWSCPGLAAEWIQRIALAFLALFVAVAYLRYWRRSRRMR